jgi:hypothetical protein
MIDGKLVVCQEYKELPVMQPIVAISTFDDNATQGQTRQLAVLSLPVYRVLMPGKYRRGIGVVSAEIDAVFFAEWTGKLYAVSPALDRTDCDFEVTLAGLNIRQEVSEQQQSNASLLTVAWLKQTYAYSQEHTLTSVQVVPHGFRRELVYEPILR